MNLEKQRGFIALFSVIIISSMLILVAVSLSFSGFFGRFNILDSELKARTAALADACIEHVRLALALNNTFSGTDEISVSTNTCNYEVSGEEIIAWAEINDIHTIYFVEVDKDDGDIPIVDFKECPELSTCP